MDDTSNKEFKVPANRTEDAIGTFVTIENLLARLALPQLTKQKVAIAVNLSWFERNIVGHALHEFKKEVQDEVERLRFVSKNKDKDHEDEINKRYEEIDKLNETIKELKDGISKTGTTKNTNGRKRRAAVSKGKRSTKRRG